MTALAVLATALLLDVCVRRPRNCRRFWTPVFAKRKAVKLLLLLDVQVLGVFFDSLDHWCAFSCPHGLPLFWVVSFWMHI